ncbi:hypothetical protein MHM93_07775 [Pseudoalteromonas sp. MM17-2]|uniref:hypothetical protein n=1 Tax=Pseudoalteromonas sp. MM17-2 TaxID=2917753 RepID=UPI001EF58485|nr:hypothetical protein [Pseudoalteromonas sp. MM17-2]MCG7544078.1 hypothetical protein [Pseudoalteromonas sp. MM17-2]
MTDYTNTSELTTDQSHWDYQRAKAAQLKLEIRNQIAAKRSQEAANQTQETPVKSQLRQRAINELFQSARVI